jgi:hypothetical protein
MATATVLQFMQKTADDEALRQQLEALLGVGDGNISGAAELDAAESEALKGERAPVVAEFAAGKGFTFSPEELVTVVDAFQKYQAGELSDIDFATVVGLPTTEQSAADTVAEATSPLKRLARYMSKTYLGIELN